MLLEELVQEVLLLLKRYV